MDKKKVAISIDYVLRFVPFLETYKNLREIILSSDFNEQESGNKDSREFWEKVKYSPEQLAFYQKSVIKDYKEFDYTWKKYFYDDTHRQRFLEDYSFNLFGQGTVTNKLDVRMINLAQANLCDIYLFDRIQHPRKVFNTYSYLSKSGVFTKGVLFFNTNEEIEQFKKECFMSYDPLTDNNLVISPNKDNYSKPSLTLYNFMVELEKKVNENK